MTAVRKKLSTVKIHYTRGNTQRKGQRRRPAFAATLVASPVMLQGKAGVCAARGEAGAGGSA
jgi:hypothetical protein